MVELRGVSAGYPGHPVLRDIDLTFRPGQVLTLIGPNGCGKSTLLKTACGLLPRSGGEILVDGVPLERLRGKALARKVSFLAQSRSTPEITARRMVLHGRFPYLSYPRRYQREDHRIVRQALERVGAAHLAEQLVSRLSGGQRQNVYIAMTLAQDCGAVLLDEPTTYLDVAHQLRILELARSLADEGRAVVLVMHDLPLALRGADRVAVLAGGRLCRTGTPEEIYQSGIVDQVFSVRLRRMETESGWQYFCEL